MTDISSKFINSIDETLEGPIYIIANSLEIAEKIIIDVGNFRSKELMKKCIAMESHNLSTRLQGVWEDQMYFHHSVAENLADLTDNDIKFLKIMNQQINLDGFKDSVTIKANKVLTKKTHWYERVWEWVKETYGRLFTKA